MTLGVFRCSQWRDQIINYAPIPISLSSSAPLFVELNTLSVGFLSFLALACYVWTVWWCDATTEEMWKVENTRGL
jgi:hypothetical protein